MTTRGKRLVAALVVGAITMVMFSALALLVAKFAPGVFATPVPRALLFAATVGLACLATSRVIKDASRPRQQFRSAAMDGGRPVRRARAGVGALAAVAATDVAWSSYASSDDDSRSSANEFDEVVINPATGLMMCGGIGGLDAMGNAYGSDTMSASHHNMFDDH